MEQTYVTVSSKGQLVIPAAIREELGIEPGTRVAVRREGPELILKPETLAAKLAMIKKMRGIAAGGPSLCDELLEDRRRERERELREEGW
jgi:AbrB family looped-hinge helix DNA binding protein